MQEFRGRAVEVLFLDECGVLACVFVPIPNNFCVSRRVGDRTSLESEGTEDGSADDDEYAR